MENRNSQIIMVIATAVIAFVAVFGFFYTVVNPQIQDLRQELRDTRRELRQEIKDSEHRILTAIEKSEERMLQVLAGHTHDEDGQVLINLPK